MLNSLKPFLRHGVGAACIAVVGLVPPIAQAADNASASATAEVLVPIAVVKATDLVFGNVVPGNGDITLSTSGARTRSGGTAFSTSGAAPTAAKFDITGSGNNTFSILYTGSDTVLTGPAAATMAIDWITEAVTTATPTNKTDETTDASTGTLASGAAFIYVGAKLTVGGAQAAGTYTGNVVVTVGYN